MKKILLVSPFMEQPRGGIAVWTDMYLKECANYDISAAVLNIALIGKRGAQGNQRRSIADEIIRTFSIFKNLRSLLKKDTYDAVHINTSCATYGIIRDYYIIRKIKKRFPTLKAVLQCHCHIPTQIHTNLQQKYLKKILAYADDVLTLNQISNDCLEESFSFSGKIVPNGIDEKNISAKDKVIRENITKAVFVGYVQPQKGFNEIITVAEKLPQISFELIGEAAPAVQQLKIPENISFLGLKTHKEIFDLLDDGDVFFFPTHSEGFSIALLEAMARGVPVIATDVGANRDMIEDKGGIIVDVGDTEAMINAFYGMKDKNIRADMSKWLIEKTKSSYTVKQVMKKISDTY